MKPDRDESLIGRTPLSDPALSGPKAEPLQAVHGATADVTGGGQQAALVDDTFLSDFFGGDDAPSMDAYEELPVAAFVAPQEAESHLEFNDELNISALRAERSLQQVFALNSPTEALALAAMPHYDLGGQASIRMGQLELRYLLAEAEATLKGATQHVTEGTKLAIREGGEVQELPTRASTDIRADADAVIGSLLAGGYIREVTLTNIEQESVDRINEILREDLPKDWKVLDTQLAKRKAYELTDTGIEAGRSIRAWDGNSLEAGMVRLPDGEPMPPVVASDTYDLSAVVMETRSLAGILKPGELGTYLKAELASIEYSHEQGTNPQVTAGRLDGVVSFAKVAALGQVQNGMRADGAPLTPSDMAQIADRGRRLLERIPEVVPEISEGGDVIQNRGLDKWGSMADIAHLEGVRIACEAISFRMGKAGVDMTDPRSWAGSAHGLAEQAQPGEQENTMAMADAIKVMKNWMKMVADKGESIRDECMAFAEGSFGAKGHAIAERLLARA